MCEGLFLSFGEEAAFCVSSAFDCGPSYPGAALRARVSPPAPESSQEIVDLDLG